MARINIKSDKDTPKGKSGKKEKKETFGESILSWTKTILGAIIVVMLINGVLVASFVVPTPSMEKTVMTGDFLFVNKYIYGPTSPQLIPFLNIPLPFFRIPAPFVKEPEKGDVIVFIYPGDRDDVKAKRFDYYLKRCVATAGDTLQVVNKQLIVNGKKCGLPEGAHYSNPGYFDPYEYLRTFPPGRNYTKDNYGPIRIPKKGDVITLSQDNYREWETFIRREGHEFNFDGLHCNVDGKPITSYTVERNYCFGMGDNRDNSEDSRFWGFVPYNNVVGTPMIVYWSWDTNVSFSKLFKKIGSTRWSRIGRIIH